MILALSMLCEHPTRKTGLTSLYHEFVEKSLAHDAELRWIIYVAPNQEWKVEDERVTVVREFVGNDQLGKRLVADHLLLATDAKKRGADVLVTTGFVPLRCPLPCAMHMLSLQHLQSDNKVGWLRSSYRKFVARHGLKNATLVITNTRFAISQILGEDPQVEPKLIQSYEGLQHDHFRPEKDSGEEAVLEGDMGVRPGYLYWCSNFYPYKQADLLIKAYARLEPELREEMPLVMAGGGNWGDTLERVKEQIEAEGLTKQVKFLGWVPDELLGALYRNARLFVLPSREETFGRCVLEAMACGTPCVVNSIPVMDEVTAGFGSIVDFSDTDATVAALQEVACDPVLRERYIKGGLEHATNFSFERLASERVEAIRKHCLSK